MTSSFTTARCPSRGIDQGVLIAVDDRLDVGSAVEQVAHHVFRPAADAMINGLPSPLTARLMSAPRSTSSLTIGIPP